MSGRPIETLVQHLRSVDPTTLALFCWVATMSYLFMNGKKHRNFPPGSKSNLLSLFDKTNIDYPAIMRHNRQTYKTSLTSIRPWFGDIVCLHSLDAVKKLFVEQSDVSNDRPSKITVMNHLLAGNGIVSANGAKWREARRFTMTTLRNLGLGRNSVDQSILEESLCMVEHLEANQGVPFDPNLLGMNAVSNVICNLVFGHRFDYESAEFKNQIVVLESLFEHLHSASMSMYIPYAWHIPGTVASKLVNRTNTMFDFINAELEEHRQRYDPAHCSDFIDHFIKETQERKESTVITAEGLVITVRDLFMAGTETTSTLLYWTYAYLVHRPELQAKVQREIDAAVGRDRLPDVPDLAHIPLVEAVMWETLRMSSMTPVLIPHELNQSIEFDGYHIPAGTTLITDVEFINTNPAVWGQDADCYRPERFLEDQKLAGFIPFGVGPRMCLGDKLAKSEYLIFLTTILHQFDLTPCDVLPDMTKTRGVLVKKLSSYKICFSKRLS